MKIVGVAFRKWEGLNVCITDYLPIYKILHSLCVGGLEEHIIMQVSLIFAIICQFYVFIVLLSLVYFFRRISDSEFTFLKNNSPNLLGISRSIYI